MADEATKKESKEKVSEGAAAPAEVKSKNKKSWPTNCTQSNKRIRRKDWYYRDGKYFANKQCYKLYVAQEAKKAREAAEKAAAAVGTATA